MQEWAKGDPDSFSQPHRMLQRWICSSQCPGWVPKAGPPSSQGSCCRQLCSVGPVAIIESTTIIQDLLHVGHTVVVTGSVAVNGCRGEGERTNIRQSRKTNRVS